MLILPIVKTRKLEYTVLYSSNLLLERELGPGSVKDSVEFTYIREVDRSLKPITGSYMTLN